MRGKTSMKPVNWLGDSLKVLRSFPRKCSKKLGTTFISCRPG